MLRCLAAEDWKAIDNAFSQHSDPLFGENLRAGLEALFERITRDTESRLGG